MEHAPPPRPRRPLGILEAALLLVLAGAGLWIVRPVPRARRAAAAEKDVQAALAAIADAEDARAAGRRGYLPLDPLTASEPALAKALAGFRPSTAAGVLGNGSYWIAVHLPGADGALGEGVPPDPDSANRGYVVLAWPRSGAPHVLRALAALPAGVTWQRADGMEESGDPARPPVPRVVFPVPGKDGPEVPDPPSDWVVARKRR